MFADGMITFVENPKEMTNKLLEVIHNLSKAAGCIWEHGIFYAITLWMKTSSKIVYLIKNNKTPTKQFAQ